MTSDVITAASPIAAPETAPCSSPSLAASAVPIPWAIVPIASPRGKGFEMFNKSINHGPSIAPHIPVIMTNAATSRESAPIIEDTSEATGIVIDLTVRDTRIVLDKCMIFASTTADMIVDIVPANSPASAGKKLLAIIFLCR